MQQIKLVVSGAFDAGKTQFIHTASDVSPVSTERRVSDATAAIKPLTTTAMDFGRTKLDADVMLHLYGTPGQQRFEFMWSALARGMRGLVLMVDSTRPQTFKATHYISSFFAALSGDTPVIVAANKQDQPDALPPDQVREALGFSSDVPVLPCVAVDRASVLEVLQRLVALVDMGSLPRLNFAPLVIKAPESMPMPAKPIEPQPPALLAAVSLRDKSKKHHLTRGGGATLCGRALGSAAVPMIVFGTDDCQTCLRRAVAQGLTCIDCGRPLTRSNGEGLCLACEQHRNHPEQADLAVLDALAQIDPRLRANM